MNNFERITKSPDKLADWLSWRVNCRMCPAEDICGKNQGECTMAFLEWLKEESGE
jgi:hypothetical protein